MKNKIGIQEVLQKVVHLIDFKGKASNYLPNFLLNFQDKFTFFGRCMLNKGINKNFLTCTKNFCLHALGEF